MQGSPLFWDKAQLQEGQPRTVPMGCPCPLSLGMAGAAWQQQHSWQLHTAQGQIPANSTPGQHCREELALDIYYDQT